MTGSPWGARWTTTRDEQLRGLLATKMSPGQIGIFLGISRNSVIGRMNRIGLKSRYDRSRSIAPKRRSAGNTALRINDKAGRPPLEPMQANLSLDAFNAAIPAGQRVSLMELQSWHCRWPLFGGTERSGLYCGDPNADLSEGRPYCTYHARQAFKPSVKPPYVPNY